MGLQTAMQQTQILTFGLTGIAVERLRELATARRIWLRETNQFSACQNLLQAGPTVFIVQLGRDLERELTLVGLAHASAPSASIVVIGEADSAGLAGVAWEFGATYALFPPTPVERLNEVVNFILREKAP